MIIIYYMSCIHRQFYTFSLFVMQVLLNCCYFNFSVFVGNAYPKFQYSYQIMHQISKWSDYVTGGIFIGRTLKTSTSLQFIIVVEIHNDRPLWQLNLGHDYASFVWHANYPNFRYCRRRNLAMRSAPQRPTTFVVVVPHRVVGSQ